MGNKNYKEERFDSFLNKTIILSSKQYYRNEIAKDLKELKIIDDENYAEFMENYLKYDEVYNLETVDTLIKVCENPMLIQALQSLSDIEMTVILLLFKEQLTNIESGKILKICTKSVARIKKRALSKIKKYLKGDE